MSLRACGLRVDRSTNLLQESERSGEGVIFETACTACGLHLLRVDRFRSDRPSLTLSDCFRADEVCHTICVQHTRGLRDVCLLDSLPCPVYVTVSSLPPCGPVCKPVSSLAPLGPVYFTATAFIHCRLCPCFYIHIHVPSDYVEKESKTWREWVGQILPLPPRTMRFNKRENETERMRQREAVRRERPWAS